jgi:hypothetical protein
LLSLAFYKGCSYYNFVIVVDAVTFYVKVEVYLEELCLKLIAFSIVLIRRADAGFRGRVVGVFGIRGAYNCITYLKGV